MRILLVIDSLGSGGAQRLFVNLAKKLNGLKHDVEMFIYTGDTSFFRQELTDCGIRILEHRKDQKGFSFNVLNALRAVLRNDYDSIISAMHTPSIYVAMTLGLRARTTFVVCELSSSLARGHFVRRFLFWLATIRADRVVANSITEAENMRRWPGLSKKISTIWNGYELSQFKASLEAPKATKKLAIVGRIAYPKNGVNVIKALKLFHSRNNYLPLIVWVGRPDTDPLSVAMQKQMTQMIEADKNLTKSVNFPGEIADVSQIYREVDGIIHMSTFEGLPNVICEAMLSGCPVLASDVCDHPLVLGSNGERGLICDPLDPLQICQLLESFFDMSIDEKANMVSRARSFGKENFDIDNMAMQYLSLTKKVLS